MRLKRLLHRYAAAFSPHTIRVGLRREVNHKIHIPWAMHATDQQNVAERPSCSQLIHNPLFILAFAFVRWSIETEVARFKKKMMHTKENFCCIAQRRKKQGPMFAKNIKPCKRCGALRVVVHVEFPRMRTQAHLILFFALHFDPGVDDVVREHIALQEELVVIFQFVAGLGEAARH